MALQGHGEAVGLQKGVCGGQVWQAQMDSTCDSSSVDSVDGLFKRNQHVPRRWFATRANHVGEGRVVHLTGRAASGERGRSDGELRDLRIVGIAAAFSSRFG